MDDSLLSRSASGIYDILQLKRKTLDFWQTEISVILPDVVEVEDGALPSGLIFSCIVTPYTGLTGFLYRCLIPCYHWDNRTHSISIVPHHRDTNSSKLRSLGAGAYHPCTVPSHVEQAFTYGTE